MKIIDLLNKIANGEFRELSNFGTYFKYYINNSGTIVNSKGKILKTHYDKYGYERIMLRNKSGKRKLVCIHRLVAEAFIPNPNNYACINHKDENPKNNNVLNLEWCSIDYNNKYGSRRKRAIANMKKPIICITTNKIYDSATDVERELNISRNHISECCRGKRKTCGGYEWRFLNEDYRFISKD